MNYFFQLTIRVSDVNDNAPKFELPGNSFFSKKSISPMAGYWKFKNSKLTVGISELF